MFGQLLPNKNKIATVRWDTYYANFVTKAWNLNEVKERNKEIWWLDSRVEVGSFNLVR
jgi:hypothetical protein